MISPAIAVVNGRGARRARRGHPWVYDDDVLEASGEPGDVVRVVDRAGAFCCHAAYSPRSRIVLRRISRTDQPLDDAYWDAALGRALAHRGAAAAAGPGSARLLHADADGFPGLIVDRYGTHLVAQATTVWADRALPALGPRLLALSGGESLLARNDAGVRQLEQLPRHVVQLAGVTPAELEVEEADVIRIVDPWRGHKTGYYLDQQENHRAAPLWLKGRVLDAFSADGGFAVPLALAGAEVTAIDQSGPLLARAERSARRTAAVRGVDAEGLELTLSEENVFDALARFDREGVRFDGIVLDPPPFARHRSEAAGAARGYRDLQRRAFRLLVPGGRLLTFSCSFAVDEAAFEALVREGAEEAGASVRVVARPGAASDHPDMLLLPESRYLKGLLLEKDE